jgi:hypothetical protein
MKTGLEELKVTMNTGQEEMKAAMSTVRSA